MSDLTFRAAGGGDRPALAEVFGRIASDEQLGMAGGSAKRADRFRAVAMSSVFSAEGIGRTIVAERGGEVVGLLQSGAETGDRISPGLVIGVVRVFGVLGVRGFLRRDRARARVHIPPPPGSYHIAELHVLSNCRNLGIGAALLEEGERRAREQGFAEMSLTTTTSNPARRLYERTGFELRETKRDPEYLALTGIEGRVLMVKRLE